MTRIAFTGGRDYGRPKRFDASTPPIVIEADRERVRRQRQRHDRIMNAALERLVMTEAGVGDATGLDELVRDWCPRLHVPLHIYRADWNRLGRAAGPERNGRMLREFAPEKLLAFPGGAGTADCVSQAEALGIEVLRIDWERAQRPIFVFGSNRTGRHGKGAALAAVRNHGAIRGQGEGLQGSSYAIPTKDHRVETLPLAEIAAHVRTFIAFAELRTDLTFKVTPIGCGLAGYTPAQIAPLFDKAPDNCRLPEEFVSVLRGNGGAN